MRSRRQKYNMSFLRTVGHPILAVIAYLSILAVAKTSQAQPFSLAPEAITYSGILLDPSGTPFPDGSYAIAFFLTDVPTGNSPGPGGSLGIWGPLILDDTQGSGPGIGPNMTTVGGRYSVTLGPSDAFGRGLGAAIAAQSANGGDLYLDVWIFDGFQYVPLPNRQKIISAPFAAVAGNAPPPGTIIMWSGNTVPAGWLLCDGTNNTPNLRDQFVKGATTLGVYASGLGSSTHSHTMDAHAHSMSHTHTMNHTHTSNSHTHSVDPPNTTSSSYGTNETLFGDGGLSLIGSHSHTVDIASFTSGGTTPSTSSDASATTTGASSLATTGNSSTGVTASTTASNDPLHYKLAFIMKQ